MAAMVKLPQPVDNLMVRVEDQMGQLIRTFEIGSKPAEIIELSGMVKIKTVIHCRLANTM